MDRVAPERFEYRFVVVFEHACFIMARPLI